MNSEENKDLEIVMGENSNLEISEVGDIINDLKPNTSKEKKSIIIPVSMNKSQNSDSDQKENDDNTNENDSNEIDEPDEPETDNDINNKEEDTENK